MKQQDRSCHDEQLVYLLPISTTSSRFRLVGSSLPTRALCSSTAPASNRFLCSFVTTAVLATTPTAAPAIRPALLADSAQNHELSYMSPDVPDSPPMQDVLHLSLLFNEYAYRIKRQSQADCNEVGGQQCSFIPCQSHVSCSQGLK